MAPAKAAPELLQGPAHCVAVNGLGYPVRANRCAELATYLETDTFDDSTTEEFKTEEQLTAMLLRVAEKDGYTVGTIAHWLREVRDEEATATDAAAD